MADSLVKVPGDGCGPLVLVRSIWILRPPSISRQAPVRNPASSEARKRTALATSPGVARRLIGMPCTTVASRSSGSLSMPMAFFVEAGRGRNGIHTVHANSRTENRSVSTSCRRLLCPRSDVDFAPGTTSRGPDAFESPRLDDAVRPATRPADSEGCGGAHHVPGSKRRPAST